MAPFYYDENYSDGYSKGLTPLIIRMSTIAVVVASFFQSGNSSVETITTLVLAVVLFEVATKLTQFSGKVLKQSEYSRHALSGRQVLQVYFVRRICYRHHI